MQSVLLDSFLIVWNPPPPVEITTLSGLAFSAQHGAKAKRPGNVIANPQNMASARGRLGVSHVRLGDQKAFFPRSLSRDTGSWDRRFDDVVARLLIATMAQIRRRSRRSDPSCSGLFLDGIIAQLGFVVVRSFCTDD